MKIIYLHQYFNTPEMPGGTRSFELARRLVRSGHEVHMITTWREETVKKSWFKTNEAGIIVHWLPVKYSNKMGFYERLKAFISFAVSSSLKACKIRGDVIFATSTPLTIAIPGIISSLVNNKPMVFEVRDLWPEVPIAMGFIKNPIAIFLAEQLELLAYKMASHIIPLAPGMQKSIVEKGIEINKTTVIPNGCDLSTIDSIDCQNFIAPDWIDNNTFLIVYTGTVGIANGVEYIPRLARSLSELDPQRNIKFAIVGSGKEENAVKILAKKLKVMDNNVFFIGNVSKSDAFKWIKRSNATIMTYSGPEVLYRDSVSNKFFDSIAARKPVFANFRGFSTITAEQSKAGAILSSNTDEAALELHSLISNHEWLSEASANAYKLANEKFARDDQAKILEEVLAKVASN